jgi:hypothetical protein
MIKKVLTDVSSGSYGKASIIPIFVTFSFPVVVSSCPRILFQINGFDRFAIYDKGSGSNSLLFNYEVQYNDYASEFDYYD